MMKVVPTRVGAAFQAEIPPLLTPVERHRAKERELRPCQPRWTPSQSALSDDEIDEYLHRSRMNESESALRCLHDSGFDVHKATVLLHKDRQRRARADGQRTVAISDDDFEAAVQAHGKCFFAIQQLYPKTQTSDLIDRFYLWKTTTAYKKWHERAKNKKNKVVAQLRQWADAEGESDTSDFHNEHCELCFTGGQLLCCDGCERAYHFSCVEPPIKDVPMGDWFCVACAAILGTSAELRPSSENPYCDEVVLLQNIPLQRSLPCRNHVVGEIDNGVATDGNDTEEIEDTTMDGDEKTDAGVVVIKQEPAVYHHPRLYTPERSRQLPQTKRPTANGGRAATPTRSPLLLESTNRKRQRKIVAPRRIPQSDVRPLKKK